MRRWYSSTMARHDGRTQLGALSIVLLAVFCFLGPATHGQFLGWRTAVMGTSAASGLPEENHEHIKGSVHATATRIRQLPASIPIPATMAIPTAVLGAVLLSVLAARGARRSRAPNNFGRQRLIALSIDRR